jgi:hypothetical protein
MSDARETDKMRVKVWQAKVTGNLGSTIKKRTRTRMMVPKTRLALWDGNVHMETISSLE